MLPIINSVHTKNGTGSIEMMATHITHIKGSRWNTLITTDDDD